MGASRKLQGEIDRVLKKVQEGVDVFDSIWNKVYDTENANQKEKFEADLKKEIKKLQRYRDQIKTWIQSSEIKDKKALMDARKLIEKEMERFKICEKETKTKAFSKEGLGQQPKTDPKEKAKSETRDWLNNVVGDLETQIDSFEAEVEGLSVKKGKTRPPRLVHLETSIARHKAHILKLELILRLLDNDELSPEQVNDVKEFLEDYVERNQDDFEDFSDVDDLYSSLPLEKVEALEDLVGSSGLVKDARKLHNMVPHQAVGSVSATNAAIGLKSSLANSSSLPIDSSQDQSEEMETGSHDGSSDSFSKTPPSKSTPMQSLVSTAAPNVVSGMQPVSISSSTGSAPTRLLVGPTLASIFSAPANTRSASETTVAVVSPSLPNISSSVKEDDSINFPGRRSSPVIPEIGIGRGISRGLSSQSSLGAPTNLVSISGISGPPGLGAAPAVSDVPKRNILTIDERISTGGIAQPVVSPLSNRTMLQQVSKAMDGATDSNNVSEVPAAARVFSPSPVTGVQWRPQTPTPFQTQHETGQVRGRPEIAPDQREKFLQRLQQVQQQGPGNLLGAPILSGLNTKQFSSQPQNSFLQQFNSQSSSLSPQVGLGLGIQAHTLNSVASAQQQSPIHQQSSQHSLIPSGSKDDLAHVKIEEPQQQNLPEDSNVEPTITSGFNKTMNDDELKTPYVPISSSMSESAQLSRDSDLATGQPLQPTLSSAGLGFFGRRSIPDLGAIGDNVSSSVGSSGGMHDEAYNKQMLDAALARLPLPTDSDCIKSYIPRRPAVTPASYAQQQAPVINNPAFWERLGIDQHGTDVLFFAFYFQQKTYQQYLAAKELKRWAWRYHKKYNTWFQRHEEPKVTTDEFERGTYVYFDFHIADDGSQHGWCQRIKTEFTFEYNYLEDELVV